jgi:hypothetical protein
MARASPAPPLMSSRRFMVDPLFLMNLIFVLNPIFYVDHA